MISEQHIKSVSNGVCRIAFALLISFTIVDQAKAQLGGFNPNRIGVVGGVSVDAQGALHNASQQEREGILKLMRDSVHVPQGSLAKQSQLRMVSLSGLQSEIARAMKSGEQLSEEVLYLAGLQRIEYIFVFPSRQDIVIAGPAEGWRVRDDATVVGKTSGRPVIQLEDLLVAFRTADLARQQPISVSIDPTPEGSQNLSRFLKQVRTGPGFDPARIEPAMRQAFGPQQVKLTTVATDTRMAHTLLAADYHMKRLAMNLEESPVAGLVSYMEMIRNTGAPRGVQPRWWMSCDYDSILHSDDHLAWKISGLGIRAMTEDDYVDSNGARLSSGRANQTAQRWADLFTSKFDELCRFNAAFGDLRNVMDLNVVATVIRGHELEQLAGCSLSLILGQSGDLETPKWRTPKSVPPECSFVNGANGWVVSASGGVDINPWKIVSENSQSNDEIKSIYFKAEGASSASWWWE